MIRTESILSREAPHIRIYIKKRITIDYCKDHKYIYYYKYIVKWYLYSILLTSYIYYTINNNK